MPQTHRVDKTLAATLFWNIRSAGGCARDLVPNRSFALLDRPPRVGGFGGNGARGRSRAVRAGIRRRHHPRRPGAAPAAAQTNWFRRGAASPCSAMAASPSMRRQRFSKRSLPGGLPSFSDPRPTNPHHPNVPVVPVVPLLPGALQPTAQGPTVWQRTGLRTPVPGPGPVLPPPKPSVVGSLLRGVVDRRWRWVQAWEPVWHSRWI